jgi:hypothetical protein
MVMNKEKENMEPMNLSVFLHYSSSPDVLLTVSHVRGSILNHDVKNPYT